MSKFTEVGVEPRESSVRNAKGAMERSVTRSIVLKGGCAQKDPKLSLSHSQHFEKCYFGTVAEMVNRLYRYES